MNIIIPLGGTGMRFKKAGYNVPKALIPVLGTPILFYLLNNLHLSSSHKITIPYNHQEYGNSLHDLLFTKYPEINLVPIEKTEGAADTIRQGLEHLSEEERNRPTICIDSDNFYLVDILSEWNGENVVFTFIDKNIEPRFSYSILNENKEIIQIREKEKISDLASCGSYGFSSGTMLLEWIKKTMELKIKDRNEYYLSTIISSMIDSHYIFRSFRIPNSKYFSLGTPEQVKEYETVMMFDLDGTLVNTDSLYIRALDKLYMPFLHINPDIFSTYIQGRGDKDVIETLFLPPSFQNQRDFSNKKDDYFIKEIEEEGVKLLPGVSSFLERWKNCRMIIVSNSNRNAVDKIMNTTLLSEYIYLSISSSEVICPKPNPEPYQKALQKENLSSHSNLFIFEDSESGLKSAKQLNCPSTIIRIDSSGFKNIHPFHQIMDDQKISMIRSIGFEGEIQKISSTTGEGYICKIDRYTINESIHILCKYLDSKSESEIVKQLGLVPREVKFYHQYYHLISALLPVPKIYGLFHTHIFMQDIRNGTYPNTDDLQTNIQIIRYLVQLHKNTLTTRISAERYKDLPFLSILESRFSLFLEKINKLVPLTKQNEYKKIYEQRNKISEYLSTPPFSIVHGDVKRTNMIQTEREIYFIDWQYMRLGKGISDLVFFLVESVNPHSPFVPVLLREYTKKMNISYDSSFLRSLLLSLYGFPFFVMVWFGSEEVRALKDPTFPIRFRKNFDAYLDLFQRIDRDFCTRGESNP